MTTTFTTPTLHCGGCAANVRAALLREPGVHAVQVTLAEKRVQVAFDAATTSRDRLSAALRSAGYPPSDATDPAVADARSRAIDAVLL